MRFEYANDTSVFVSKNTSTVSNLDIKRQMASPAFMKFLNLVLLIWLQQSLAANPEKIFVVAPDSIGMYHEGDSTYIIHELDSGETIFALSRKYGCRVSDILESNKSIAPQDIAIGTALYVPWSTNDRPSSKAILDEKDVSENSGNPPWGGDKEFSEPGHRVMKGETIFSISRLYKDVSAADLMDWNHLENTDITPGQYLRISPPKKGEVKQPLIKKMRVDSLNEVVYANYGRSYRNLTAARGIATWSAGRDQMSHTGGYFALHNSAPIGSVIRVKNPMNGRLLYAKVIGRIPENKTDHRSLVKISGNAARALGVLDQKFLAEIEYLSE